MAARPPPGFSVHTRTSPATRGREPLFAATDTGVFRLGIVVGALITADGDVIARANASFRVLG